MPNLHHTIPSSDLHEIPEKQQFPFQYRDKNVSVSVRRARSSRKNPAPCTIKLTDDKNPHFEKAPGIVGDTKSSKDGIGVEVRWACKKTEPLTQSWNTYP